MSWLLWQPTITWILSQILDRLNRNELEHFCSQRWQIWLGTIGTVYVTHTVECVIALWHSLPFEVQRKIHCLAITLSISSKPTRRLRRWLHCSQMDYHSFMSPFCFLPRLLNMVRATMCQVRGPIWRVAVSLWDEWTHLTSRGNSYFQQINFLKTKFNLMSDIQK